MSDFKLIDFIRRDGRADLTLKNPPNNMITVEMLEEILNALDQIRDDDTLKVLVIRGSGGIFSGGVSPEDLTADRVGNLMPLYSRLYIYLNDIRGLTMAAVEGVAMGAGCELAAFCDVTIAAENARFGFPEIKLGLFPPIATAILPRIIGRNRTLDWILSGRDVSAVEASEANMVARTIPRVVLDEFIDNYADRIGKSSAPAVVLTKRAVDTALYTPAMEALRTTESTFMLDLMNCIDPHEGLKAGIEGRPPVWRNR